MSSKMFMSFFLQLKRNEGFWGKHSRILVDFSGGQSVEGPSWSFSAASKDDPSWEIRVLSRETVGHFLRKIQIYIVFNHKCSSWTSLASHYVNTHVTHARTLLFQRDYSMCEDVAHHRANARWALVVKKYIYIFIFCKMAVCFTW